MSRLMELVDDLCNACHYRAAGLVAHGREEALEAVEAAVAELERDAARYRHAAHVCGLKDEEIDAAMEADK